MKIHLLDSDEPLLAGKNHVALCGTEVPSAYFVFGCDTNFAKTPESWNSFQDCRKCNDFLMSRRYQYGMISGEESVRHEVAEEEMEVA